VAWSELAEHLRQTEDLTGVSAIARRYFAMNAFDGTITIIGVLGGSYSAGVTDPKIVLTTGLSTAVAMGISGLWGAYLTESAERDRELTELSQQMLTDVKQTGLGKASRTAVYVVTVVDGASPVLAALISLLPFFFAARLPSIEWAYGGGLGLSLVSLLGLGLFLGHISRGRMLAYALKTLVAGVLAIAIGLLLG
jgi:predicted membrane protein (TIGR00267 family)